MEKIAPDPPKPSPNPRILGLSSQSEGTRLDLFLAAQLGLSRAQARRLLERGAVALDGRRLGLSDKGTALGPQGELSVAPFAAPADQQIPPPGSEETPPGVLAQGSGWLALDKPAGMPVHPLVEGETGTLLGHVFSLHPEIHGVGEGGLRSGVVHRLDVDTSGVMLVATAEPAWARIRAGFQEHRVAKRYLALVEGEVEWPADGLELSLALRVARHRPAQVRVATPEEADRGRARVIEQTLRSVEVFSGASLVEVRPRTGFLHQIRASLAHLGHPVVGDVRYGAEPGRGGAGRHMLHAAEIGFEEIVAEATPPPDFHEVLEALR
ncbi:MAG: RluA family pseudouridine synthase [Myxococcota bacterium]|nr:RluA family pseudouridine synthase [Myxococcota bacterium]